MHNDFYSIIYLYKCSDSVYNFFHKNIGQGFILQKFSDNGYIKQIELIPYNFLLIETYDDISNFNELLLTFNSEEVYNNIILLGDKKFLDYKVLNYTKTENNFLKIIKHIQLVSENLYYKRKYTSLIESIEYAGKIQKAILPDRFILNETFSEYFIFNKPRDIVSGDFYWLAENKDSVFVAVGDCTGHGVPGAFMSILSITLLNEILYVDGIYETDKILNSLRENIITSLKQSFEENIVHDGLDISLCSFKLEYDLMQFSGAFNSIYIIRDKQLKEIKADRMPVGVYLKDHETFSNELIDIKGNDCIYLMTDGYSDQTGANKNKKLRKKNVEKLLLSVCHQSMNAQCEYLERFMGQWKGINEQIDDMLIIGIKI